MNNQRGIAPFYAAFSAFAICILMLLLPADLSSQQPAKDGTPPQQSRRVSHLGGHPGPGPDAVENRPFVTYNTTPVILHGPFLLNPSETEVTIEWVTDTPSTAKVQYGETTLDKTMEPQENGLLPVGTLHKIKLSGLTPGTTYQYKLISTRVVRLKAYWPDKGLALESPAYRFTTFDRAKSSASFSVITDTHEDIARIDALMQMIDWKHTDFLLHTGDGVNWVENEEQLFTNWLDPISKGLDHTKPLIYARGNHDLRGPFARNLDQYLESPEEHFYFSRDVGPVHLIVIDTAEDKPDDTKVYAGLYKQAPYRQQELSWFKKHVETDERIKTAPFRVVVMHQPDWGWLDGKNKEWTDVANEGKVDLVIAGHYHRFVHFQPGEAGNTFPVLVVGQDQVAHVDASDKTIHVTVTKRDGTVVDSFDVERHSE